MGHEAEEKRRVIIQTLIDGEVSASETYRQALERAADASGLGALRRIEGDHRQAARVLKERCRAAGSAAAAPWGDWPSVVSGAANLTGGEEAIRLLKDGEENSARLYEQALESAVLDADARRVIATVLLPQTRSHIPMLDRLLRRGAGD